MSEWRRNEGHSEKRNTYKFITRVDPTPVELKKETLSGMIEHKKEREARAAVRRKRAIRTTAAAAALVLAVAATPLRGYVASAAGSVYNAIIGTWKEDVFPVKLKKSNNGCTIEIIESRVANDFLYLTVKEYYPKGMVARDDDTKLYSMPEIVYSGSIKDNEGNEIKFGSSNVMHLWAMGNDHDTYEEGYEDRVITESADSAIESGDDFVVNAQYRIYMPELASVVNSADKKYTCRIDAVSAEMNSNINFDFTLDNIKEAIGSKTYSLNRTFELECAEVTFEKLSFSDSGADLIIKIDPNDNLSSEEVKDLVGNFYVSAHARSDSDNLKFAWLYCDMLNNHGYVYDLDEDINADSMMWNKPRCMKLNGSYYLIISDFADQPDSSYDMNGITGGDFTVEIDYIRWRPQLEGHDGDDMTAVYHKLDDIAITAKKVSDSKYSFSDNNIYLEGGRGNLNISLKDISETETVKLADGSYQHTLSVNADIKYSDWDGMVKDGAWESISLVNAAGKEVVNIGMQIDTGDINKSGSMKAEKVKCVVVDNNKHFKLSENNLKLHVAKVIETQTYEPNGWFNSKYSSEDIDALNEQRYFHFKAE